jgi:hypothetical protein
MLVKQFGCDPAGALLRDGVTRVAGGSRNVAGA